MRPGIPWRFTELLGQLSTTYLTEWRLRAAADLLVDTTETVEASARRVLTRALP
ncbi:MAG TPA: hypothetical protein VN969_05620 [Streptosporangiaceae bacterium]|nr:hypothetical protein [Streptosporangiaceae bacterium]